MGDLGYIAPSNDVDPSDKRHWTRLLNKYHWFVLIVAALGWLFDTMDQQLFNFARAPAMKELLAGSDGTAAPQHLVDFYGGVATAIFLVGWASGGLIFGVLGDRIGRAKTMLFTILIYSLCTGLSSFSIGFWDFAFYRLITGLGVGGEFAVGVALVAEVMPSRARQHALSLLQALSAVGNVTAAAITMTLGHLETSGVVGSWNLLGFEMSAWRLMFLIGTLPALLAIVIRGRLKEPETWTRSVQEQKAGQGKALAAGSYAALFSDPRWRHGALVGLALATAGVIGVWGIVFFSFDLVGSVLRKTKEAEARAAGSVEANEFRLLALVAANPTLLDAKETKVVDNKQVTSGELRSLVDPKMLLSTAQGSTDTSEIWLALLAVLEERKQPAKPAADEATEPATEPATDPTAEATSEPAVEAEENPSGATETSVPIDVNAPITPEQWSAKLSKDLKPEADELIALMNQDAPLPTEVAEQEAEAFKLIAAMKTRNAEINGFVTFNKGLAGILLNIGAFFGMFGFGAVSSRIGRRPAFLIAFVIAAAAAIFVFYSFSQVSDLYWMFPIMGFCVLSPFAGYAIYFPELFPTRLRSTGTSFCYNVGRYLAATGPLTLGFLTGVVFKDAPEPLRNAGIAMCAVYLIGILALPFAKETKDQPLPED